MRSTDLTVVPDDTTEPAIDDTQARATAEDTVTAPPRDNAERLDPNELVIAENVRVSFDLADHDEEADSIREFGVRDPILGERQPDGSVHVIDGQLRTLIARAVGAETVPVWVTDADPGIDDAERRIERALVQINLNDRRVPLTDADRAAGVALMLDLGASATRVARGLQRKPSEIRATAAVGRSDTARAMLDGGQRTLDQLAVIAGYEAAGDTEAVRALSSAARYNFGYTAQRLAAERAETRARLRAALPYGAAGFGILTDEPRTDGPDAAFIPAEDLRTEHGEPVTAELIDTAPGRWAVFLQREENAELVDTDSGAPVDPDTVDWDTGEDPGLEAAEGMRHAGTVSWRDRWAPAYYLLAGQLADSELALPPPARDDEQAHAEAVAAAAAREQSRQDNRRVRQLNVRGEAARAERQKFLREYLQRRTPPAQAAAFVATHLAEELDAGPLQQVTKALGLGGSRHQLLDAIAAAPANRVWVIVLAMVLAIHEAPIDKSFWRERSTKTTRYLHLLAELADGLPASSPIEFALSEVDLAAAGDIDYRDIDIDAAA